MGWLTAKDLWEFGIQIYNILENVPALFLQVYFNSLHINESELNEYWGHWLDFLNHI